MSQVPPQYAPQYSFAEIAELPILSNGLPGSQLDGEFSRLGVSINSTISRLGELQRDDGRLRPGVVELDSLSNSVLSALAASGANIRVWQPGLAYAIGDIVNNPGTITVGGNPSPDPDVYGVLRYAGVYDDRPAYSTDPVNGLSTPEGAILYWESASNWWVLSVVDGSVEQWKNETNSPTPPETGWEPYGGTGTPVLSVNAAAGTFICSSPHTAQANFNADIAKWALIAAPPAAGLLVTDTFVADGATAVFTLSAAPGNKSNTQVFFDGVYQAKSGYSISGSSVIFASMPPNGTAIEVVTGVPATATYVTVSDGAITPEKLASGAVTTDKLAAGGITTAKLAASAVTADKLAADSVTGSKVANFSLTGEKLAPKTISGDKLANSSVGTDAIADQSVTAAKLANGSVTPSKLPAGPLTLNGAPVSADHAATKSYVDTAASTAQAAAVSAAVAADAALLPKAGGTMTGSLTMGTAPLAVPAGSAPLFAARAFARITPYYSGGITSAYKSGTYTRDGAGLITVSIPAHGLKTNDKVWLDFTSGGATDGLLTVTRIDDNTFTVPQAGAVIATSNVTARLFRIAKGANVGSVTTYDGTAQSLVVNFAVPMATADYVVLAMTSSLSANMGIPLEEADGTNQLNTVNQCFVYFHGNANPRFVSIAVFD